MIGLFRVVVPKREFSRGVNGMPLEFPFEGTVLSPTRGLLVSPHTDENEPLPGFRTLDRKSLLTSGLIFCGVLGEGQRKAGHEEEGDEEADIWSHFHLTVGLGLGTGFKSNLNQIKSKAVTRVNTGLS